MKGEAALAISDFLSSEEYAIAIAKGQPELLAAVNETIAEAKADGRLARWIVDYTAESDRLKDGGSAVVEPTPESVGRSGLAAWLDEKWTALREDFYLCFLKKAADGSSRGMYLVNGLSITLQVALASIVFGLVLGFLVAVIRSSHDKYGYFTVLVFCIRGAAYAAARRAGRWSRRRGGRSRPRWPRSRRGCGCR